MGKFFDVPLSQLTRKWRIFHEEVAPAPGSDDRSDYEEIRGKGDCRIYRYTEEDGMFLLAVSTESTATYNRLSRIPGLEPKTPCVLIFSDSFLDTVADSVNARYRRQVSEETRKRLIENGKAFRFKKSTGVGATTEG